MAKKEIPAVLTEDSIEVVKEAPKKIVATETEGASFMPNFSKTRKVPHHVAKLEGATAIRNKSYKANGYIGFPQEHAHIWHSISSTSGKEEEYCVPMLGHRHKVEMVKDKDGNYTLTCGPALVIANVKTGENKREKRFVRKLLRKALKDENGDTVEGEPAMYDEHTHDITYIKSEELDINI